jgi:putative endonuclease
MMSKKYYVYIMTNKSRTLYTGVTGNLLRRVYEHKNKLIKGFTSKYNIQYLVYYEMTSSIDSAIEREKQIKGWLRAKKIALVDSLNPEWKDLSDEWFIKYPVILSEAKDLYSRARDSSVVALSLYSLRVT